MTAILSASEIQGILNEKFPGAAEETGTGVLIKSEDLLAVADYLKTAEGLKFDYFNYITAVDYFQYFELIYQVTSTQDNRSLVFKTRVYTRDNPTVPSVTGIWRGADFQEREIYDLFGIAFEGHPNLRRIVLWEGFQGHPLRKDFTW